MVKVNNLVFGILILLFMANLCSAESTGFSLLVSPVDTNFVNPGELISYKATVSDNLVSSELPENVAFSINRTDKRPGWNPDWDYTFDPSVVKLENPTDSKVSILTIEVPYNATPGIYNHTVEAVASNFLITGGIVRVCVIHTDVNEIPEFPTIAVPVIFVLGLVTMFGRRNDKL